MRRIFFAVVTLMMLPVTLSAQDFKQYQEEFEKFRKESYEMYENFREQANKEYTQFMRDSWEWFRGEKPMPIPEIEEPVVPPVVKPEEEIDEIPEEKEMPIEEVIPLPEPAPAPEPIEPIREVPRPRVEEKWIDFVYYGSPCRVRFDKERRVMLRDARENSVADMWESLSRADYNNLLHDCLALRSEMDLCDWAYVKLVEQVAATIYSAGSNEATVLQAYMLNQSGFKILMGRSGETKLHMLIASDCDIFNCPYWTIQDEHYFLTDGTNTNSLYIFAKRYPNERPMRLAIRSENRFKVQPSEGRTLQSKQYPTACVSVSTNKNLINFYNDYPSSYVNRDPLTKWRFYAQVPLSETAREGLYPTLRNEIRGKSEAQAANLLINFVQTAFIYEYDDKVWGGDRAFFADESLYYPFCDCEDRSILFSRLVRDLMGLDVVLIYYPGHLATAVHFNEEVPGDYIVVEGKRYLICDPTYINAPIGETMPGMDNATAKAIML